MYKTLSCIALALGIGLAGATTANAHEPIQFHIEIDETDEFLSNLCGFEISATGEVRGTFRFSDNGIHVTERGRIELSANGKTLTNKWAYNFKGESSETFNDDGTLTVAFDEMYAGVPEQWIGNDGKTLIKDSGFGRISGEFTIDLGDPDDPSDDVFVGGSQDVITHGPHPILEGGVDPMAACALLS